MLLPEEGLEDDRDFIKFPNNHGFANEVCPQFDRGFCMKGGNCRYFPYHLAQIAFRKGKNICQNYMAGFCPYGPDCKQMHLKSVILDEISSLKQLANFPDSENWPPSNLNSRDDN